MSDNDFNPDNRDPKIETAGMDPVSSAMIETLIDTHGDRTMALLARILGNGDDARDAWQETWTAIWRALPRLRPAADPWPFIRQAAVRKAIDSLRARRGDDAVRPGLDGDAWPAPSTTVDAVDLSMLRREERACLTLFFWEGCSVREIATELGVPVGTVKTWMFRARGRLREQLRGGENS